MSKTFTVEIEPKGNARAWPRPGGGMHSDPKSKAWRQTFGLVAQRHAPRVKPDGPVRVSITAYFTRPQRLMRKKDPAHPLPHSQTPDADNVAKAVLDAMKAFWVDDAQVQRLVVEKWFVEKGGKPRIVVTVATYEETK